MSATTGPRPSLTETTAYRDDPGSLFGGAVLLTVGLFQFFEGLAAVAKDDVYVRTEDYLYQFDLTAWGWLHLILGVVVIGVGTAVLVGQRWALVTGIVLASLSALAQFLFLPWAPMWALSIIALNVAIIWALSKRLQTS